MLGLAHKLRHAWRPFFSVFWPHVTLHFVRSRTASGAKLSRIYHHYTVAELTSSPTLAILTCTNLIKKMLHYNVTLAARLADTYCRLAHLTAI